MSLQLGQEVRHDAVVLCEEAVLGAPLLHHSKLPLFQLCEPEWALSVLHSRPRSDLRYISHDRANVTAQITLQAHHGERIGVLHTDRTDTVSSAFLESCKEEQFILPGVSIRCERSIKGNIVGTPWSACR